MHNRFTEIHNAYESTGENGCETKTNEKVLLPDLLQPVTAPRKAHSA